MQIDLEELRAVVNRLIDQAVKTHGSARITLNAEVYWDIDQFELYDPTQKPTDIELGSLSDDWEFLGNVRKGVDIAAVQLTQVAPLLRRVGERLGEELASRGNS